MNKYQKLANNTLIFAIGSFGAKFLSFILMRLYTGCMTEEGYGTADLLYQTVNVLYPILTFSMADAVIRFGMEKGYDKRQVYTVAVIATIIGLAAFALFSPVLNLIDMYKDYGFLLYVYCYFSCFRQIASNFVRAKGYVKLFAADGIFSTLVIVICNVIFLVVLDMGVTGYVLSIIISDAVSFILLTVIAGLHKYLDITYFSKKLFKEMLKYSAPLIPTYVLWWITSASDRWFVISLCGEADNGIYSAAYKIPSLLMMFTTLFYQAWQMSAIENRNDSGLSKFYTKIYGAYSSLLMIAAAGVIMLVKPLTFLLVDNDPEKNFTFAYHYTPILVVAMVFQCLCQFTSSVYNVKKKSMNSLLTSLIAAVVNIILNFLLIPEYGPYGAAIATAASYAACFAIRIFDVRNFIPFKVNHFRMIVNVIVIGYMAFTAIKEPKLTYLQLAVLFIAVTVFNFESVLSTLRKILARTSPKKAEVNTPNK
ncbi:MAG: polysaccharide biosynthesis C-terminal domain-containing protein [Oscillospiraceae bacterium]